MSTLDCAEAGLHVQDECSCEFIVHDLTSEEAEGKAKLARIRTWTRHKNNRADNFAVHFVANACEMLRLDENPGCSLPPGPMS